MIITRENQLSLTIFITTLSALLPGNSNYPLAVIPCLFFLILKIFDQTNSKLQINSSSIAISWIIFFSVFSILSLINFLVLDNPNNAIESLLFSTIYIIYILFFIQFRFSELIKGIITGVIPMFVYMLFLELPLRLFAKNFLNQGLRSLLNLRNSNEFVLRGFFEESSHMPSLIIILIFSLIYFINLNSKNLSSKNKFFIFSCFILSSTHISGSFLVSFYLPLIIFLFLKFINKLIEGKFLLFKIKTLFSLFSITILITLYRDLIISKVTNSLIFSHSIAVRSFGFFGSIYDFLANPFLGIGAGLYRDTRGPSVAGFIELFSSNDQIYDVLSKGYLLANYENFKSSGYSFPIYSSTGYLLSETGIFFLIFIIPYLILVFKGLKFSWYKFDNFDISKLHNLLIGLIPLNYLIYFTFAFPRMLPYFVLATILTEKYFMENKKDLSYKI